MMMSFELYLVVDLFPYLIHLIPIETLTVMGNNFLNNPPYTSSILPTNHAIVNLENIL